MKLLQYGSAAVLSAFALLASAPPAKTAEQRTWNYLTTGNGHGFQVYDASRCALAGSVEGPTIA